MSVDHDANETGAADGGAQAVEPEVVDFDALNAALGVLPPAGAPSSPQLADSEGRSSATYSSARPHPIPVTRAPAELNAPAVIIAAEEPTVPSGPPMQMTVPLTPGGGFPVAPRTGPLPHGTPNNPYASDPYVAVAQHPHSDNGNVGHTMPMGNARQQQQQPRRPRTPTIVVRPRGPSRTKKLVVFVALLLVFVVGGTALLVLKPPAALGFGPKPKPTVTMPFLFPPPAPGTGTGTGTGTAPGTGTATGTVIPGVSSASSVVAPAASNGASGPASGLGVTSVAASAAAAAKKPAPAPARVHTQ